MLKRRTVLIGTRGFASSVCASFSVGGALLSSRIHGSCFESCLRRRSGSSSSASGDDVLPPKSSSLHESLGNEGPGEKRWSVKELVERSCSNSSSNSSGCVISAEEFRKTAESVKLSFDDQEEEQLARKEVEEIVRFSQMVLSSSSSSDGGGENNNRATRKDDGVEERAAERNGPTPRRRADE